PTLSGEWAGVLLRDRADIQDVHDEQVARLGALDGEGAAELVNGQQRGVQDVIGGIVVDDGSVEPFPTVDPEAVSRLDGGHRRNLRVPAVVAQLLLILELLGRIELENDLGHRSPQRRWRNRGADKRIRGAEACGAEG